MSSFVHSPATLSDLPAISQIQRAAFKESQHTMSYWTFPQHNETGIYEWRLNSMKKIFQNVPYCTYFKIVDTTTDRIVAYALWESPHPSGTEEKPQKEKEETANGDAGDVLPEGTNVELFHDFEAETERMRLKYVNSDKDYGEFWQILKNLQGSRQDDSVTKSCEPLPPSPNTKARAVHPCCFAPGSQRSMPKAPRRGSRRRLRDNLCMRSSAGKWLMRLCLIWRSMGVVSGCRGRLLWRDRRRCSNFFKKN